MENVPDRAHVVVIGAGIVGSSIVRHLAELGWRDILLLDKGPLPEPGGSTDHASNFVFPVDHSREITELTLDSLRQYAALGVLTGCGGIEVARTPERLQELRRRMTSATAWGVDAELISPARIRELMPFIREDLLLAGFHTPTGAIVDAVRAGQLMRGRALERGALQIADRAEVIGLELDAGPLADAPGRIRAVETSRGRVEAEHVVVACGVWSPQIAALAGASIPLVPAVHQMMDLGPIPELAATEEWISVPLVRDMDARMYARQRGPDLELGSYAHGPILHEPGEIPPLGAPGQASPTQMPFTERDFAPQLAHARQLYPELLGEHGREGVEVTHSINGLLSLTADGSPLLGETAEVRGLWSAAAVWIKEGPGVGRAVAEWMTEGASEVDVHGADITRIPPHGRTRRHARARAAEGFPKVYGIAHPREQWASSRPMRTSPFHPRTRALGGEHFEASGWERPQWYAANAPLLEEYADRIDHRVHEWDARWWSPIIEAEHLAMRERVAMFDLTAFSIIDISGPGALDGVQRVAVANVDRAVGRVIYTPLLDSRGGFRADLTIVRLGAQHFRVITGAADGARDLAWFRRHLAAELDAGRVVIQDLTSATCAVGLWGPRARGVVSELTDDDLSHEGFGFGTARQVALAGVPTLMVRISYVGDLGWEIHLPVEHGLRLWDALWEIGRPQGLIAAGGGVYGTTGRLEKAHRLFGAELTPDRDPVEAGLALPKVKEVDFLGKDAYLAARVQEPAAVLCTLALVGHGAAEPRFPSGSEPVLDDDGSPLVDARGRRSYVTSAGPAPSLGRYVMLAYLPPERAVEGVRLQVEYLGTRLPAEVLAVGRTAPFDPEHRRVKG
ncbi:FAD-dependent oxidoreductase [Nesterenkonia xinjiangensis]|uniref:Glycine cleavage system aminomethyltransferase T/glycine/D-amino acid oxidase-like deaminating enzyme n=1 Tax=Nesterenkonia xinjiangensis TaxID=225327 RepID=A0A7Z0KAF0_9MICC|nr:FAD-dependent oxidoreductase [Nesterenkonia xinjiangensis]NYJ78230.1 glycine cleavage system aminomethyltransferase T/glycine/D-amino acid oxidase-like deaminating enzyme [Nesterenkonia xinjiangensis]